MTSSLKPHEQIIGGDYGQRLFITLPANATRELLKASTTGAQMYMIACSLAWVPLHTSGEEKCDLTE